MHASRLVRMQSLLLLCMSLCRPDSIDLLRLVSRRSRELWSEMAYKPGARVELTGLVGSAQFNGTIGTVMGLHRPKNRYCVQLDPKGDVPHDGEEVKHLCAIFNVPTSSFAVDSHVCVDS